MKKPVRKTIAGGLLAVALLGGGAGAASVATAATSTTTTASASSTSSSTRPDRPTDATREAMRAKRAAALADELGVSTAKVTSAEAAARAAVDAEYGAPERPAADSGTKPTTPPPEPTAAQKAEMKARHDLFEKTFAEKLGVTTDQLKTAELAVEKAHLAAEVADGHLTQAEADARLQAMADGTAPMGPGGPGGPGGHGPHGQPPADSSATASSSTTTS